MSHLATVEVEIKDLDALDDACKRLGVALVRDQKTHRYYSGRKGDCDHAICVPGSEDAYEIGVVRRTDGPGYELKLDNFAGGYGLTDKVGWNGQKLKQAYASAVARRQLMRQGFRVQEQTAKNGSIHLIATR